MQSNGDAVVRWAAPLALLLIGTGCGAVTVERAAVPSTTDTVTVTARPATTLNTRPPVSGTTIKPSPTVDTTDAPAAPTTTTAPGWGLADLTVEPEQPDGYQRSLFEHWVDTDGDGCDTRQEVLLAEAVFAPAVTDGCVLVDGWWVSHYDTVTCSGSGSGCDIDHIVPLAEAWRSGAWAWNDQQRQDFANDLTNLTAVSARSNRSKQDADPGTWLPPDTAVHCWYARTWVQVKRTWHLSADEAEKTALAQLAGTCAAAGG